MASALTGELIASHAFTELLPSAQNLFSEYGSVIAEFPLSFPICNEFMANPGKIQANAHGTSEKHHLGSFYQFKTIYLWEQT
jgi:hypothetical protein